MSEERVWHVDEKDQPIGEGWQIRSNEMWQNFRVVNGFIRNSEGKIFFPRRTATKRIFPNALDMSVAGHVDWPETYDVAFARELMEELNLDANNVKLKVLGYVTPKEYPKLSAFEKVWEIEMDETPKWNPNDFTEGFWLTPGELRARVAAGEKVKGDLLVLIDIFYP